MNKKEEMRSLFKDASDKLEECLHLSEADLIAYHQGQLEEFERERVQSHLVQCDLCRRALKGVKEFLQSEGEKKMISDQALNQRWQAFRQQLTHLNDPLPWWPRLRILWHHLWTGLTWQPVMLAVSLIGMIAVGAWAWRVRQENRQLVEQWQAQQQGRMEQREQLERERRQLQQQAQIIEQQYERQLAQLSQPELNAPTFEIFSQSFIQKSTGGESVNRVTISPATRSFILILNGEGQPDYQRYAIEIRDRNGQLKWRGEGLTRNLFGNFTVGLNRSFLLPGQYRVTLQGQQDGRFRNISDYLLLVE